MFIGKWYEATILANDELEMVLDSTDADGDDSPDLYIRHSDTSKFVFVGLPVILAAALGGLYEALWKRREISSAGGSGIKSGGNNTGVEVQEDVDDKPGILAFLHNVVHYQYRPLGRYSPWLTVGEATVLFLWVIAMGSQCWQGVMNHGNHFHDLYMPCAGDPSSWCGIYDGGQPGPTPNQYRLRMVAVFMGLVCSSHFAIILIPVSRDSKIWSALGVPFERAVLYHAIAGHLAFSTLFLHAFLFVVHWVEYGGWKHAFEESIHVDPNTHGGVDTPMGWMALFCALPMWATSVNWVRRKYYSLFKLAHWLFIGVFVFGVMHWAGNTLYFLGGLALYTMHVMSRLEGWKRWRYWNRWFSRDASKASPTSLVSAVTNDSYTRLVLRNPKAPPGGSGGGKAGGGESARGGSFVYVSVPGALGTDEAHAITVAIRGPPPSSALSRQLADSIKNIPEENDVFTVYIKDLGPWTKALRHAALGAEATGNASSLLVDVDGFYSQVQSLNSMKVTAGAPRVVIVAGGSGMTSLMGFIQDWCVAAAGGADVPEVHLAWCCRYMSEFELVGEALPSLLASAGNKKDTHFTMSLYCTKGGNKEVDDGANSSSSGALSVTWPLDSTAYSGSTVERNVIGADHVAASLNHSVRVIIAGLAAYAGYILGFWEVDRRNLMNVYHEGAIIFVLMVTCIVSALVVYDWMSSLVRKYLLKGNKVTGGGDPQAVGSRPTPRTSILEESKMDVESTQLAGGVGSDAGGGVTFGVKSGRVPTEALLAEEADLAKKKGYYKVKVLTSGPSSLVDGVLAGARAFDWQLFDAEAFSFEF
eukprot:g7389.t2